MPVTPVLRRQEDCECKASLGYTAKPCLNSTPCPALKKRIKEFYFTDLI
jgi:hypothetical protein